MSQTAVGRDDVVTILIQQHQELRALFLVLDDAVGDVRRDAFHRLVRLLAVHETAEAEIVHPAVRGLKGGAAVAAARAAEEHRVTALLSTLDQIGPDAEGFDTLLMQLRDDVLAHAVHEEREEFPLLRAACGPARLHAMARAVRAAEAIAPTRPHPGVQGAKANLLLGPPLAIMDRARDLIRQALGR
ncbi:MAG: hemerythrin domain-containing protein [Labedaea sp.]